MSRIFHNIWACLLVGFILRLGFVFVALPVLETKLTLNYDADGYGLIANQILSGHYRDVERAPLYPAFVAIVFAVFLHSVVAVKFAQVLLDTMTVALVRWIGIRALPNRIAGITAGWMYAFYPLAWWRCGFINKEILETFLLALFVVSLLVALRPSSQVRYLRCMFLCGLLLGIVNLAKPVFLLLPLVLAFWFWLGRAKIRRACAAFFVLLAGMLFIITPWTFRNYIVAGEFVPVALERGGLTCFVGNYYPNRGAWEGENKRQWGNELKKIAGEHPQANSVQLDRIYWQRALQNIGAHPLQFAEMFACKAWRFWFSNASGRLGILVLVVQILFLGLGVVGAYRCGFGGAAINLFYLLVMYVWLVHAAIYADVRFSLPVMPFVMLVGAAAIAKDNDDIRHI